MYIDQNDVYGQITVNFQLLSHELTEAVEWFQNVYRNNFEMALKALGSKCTRRRGAAERSRSLLHSLSVRPLVAHRNSKHQM